MSDYNYAVFDMARDIPLFTAFPQHLSAGDRVADHPLEDLESGEPVQLATAWKTGPAVIEFGSFT